MSSRHMSVRQWGDSGRHRLHLPTAVSDEGNKRGSHPPTTWPQGLTCLEVMRRTPDPMATHVVFATPHTTAAVLVRRHECVNPSTPVVSYHTVQSRNVVGHTYMANNPLSHPAAQVEQEPDPGEEYGVAEGHSVHTDAPGAEYSPAAHMLAVPLVAPAGHQKPAGHIVHRPESSALYFPAPQGPRPMERACRVLDPGAPCSSCMRPGVRGCGESQGWGTREHEMKPQGLHTEHEGAGKGPWERGRGGWVEVGGGACDCLRVCGDGGGGKRGHTAAHNPCTTETHVQCGAVGDVLQYAFVHEIHVCKWGHGARCREHAAVVPAAQGQCPPPPHTHYNNHKCVHNHSQDAPAKPWTLPTNAVAKDDAVDVIATTSLAVPLACSRNTYAAPMLEPP
jgi:hypothetical protein